MNMDFDMHNMEQEYRLGTELLDSAFKITSTSEKLQMYNEILNMPGVDAALYLLYKAANDDDSHPRHLLQSAFMLGYYIYDSLQEVDKLWKEGTTDDPS